MTIFGKILGGAAGFALGGPLGALLGTGVGHAVDQLRGGAGGLLAGGAGADNTRKLAFTVGVIALGAKMAKADGRVTEDEVSAFEQVFRVPPEQRRQVARLFNQARRDTFGFEAYARQIAALFEPRSAVLEELLQCLFHIARADGRVDEQELDYLRRVAAIFGFGEADLRRMRAAEEAPGAADPHAVLGVSPEADAATVKAAYRRLIRENHPDTLIAQGMPEEFVAVANDKMAAINAAYEAIERQWSAGS